MSESEEDEVSEEGGDEKEEKDEEIWKPVPIEDCDHYSISSKGRVRTQYGHILKHSPNIHGYPYVGLRSTKTKTVSRSIHRLVALAFIPNPDNKKFVNHKNGDKTDYSISNLEWVSPHENIQHAHDNGLIKKASRKVNRFDCDGNIVESFESVTDACKKTGISMSAIVRACKGINNGNKARGVIFRYETEIEEKEFDKTKMKKIPGCKGYYINEKGDIYSKLTNKYLSPFVKDKNYPTVRIAGKMRLVHRLVALTFIPNPEEKEMVNHIDGNKHNHHVSNLEWVTASENCIHSYKLGSTNPNLGHHSTGKKVASYTLEGKFVKQYKSIRQASTDIECDDESIACACKGGNDNKTCCGFLWRFIEDDDPPEEIQGIVMAHTVKRKGVVIKRPEGRSYIAAYVDTTLIAVFTGIARALTICKLNKNGSGNIVKCASGKIKTAYGYTWKRIDKEFYESNYEYQYDSYEELKEYLDYITD